MTEFRRAFRPADHRIVGGVSAGLASHLGLPVLYIRLGFIVATWFNGVGILAYLILWRLLPLRRPDMAPGLESASRRGLRTTSGRPGGVELIQTGAVLAVGAGVLLLIQASGRGVGGGLFAPLVLAAIGLAVIWRQVDNVTWRQWLRQRSGWAFAARMGAGAALVLAALLYFVTQEGGWGALVDMSSAIGVAVIGLLLLLGPWIISLFTDLSEERRERVRSQERADVAAHLHDSVLQTLALLQKNAGDAAAVATLARQQERELRAWLYGNDDSPGDSLAAALQAAAADVEGMHQVAVEVIVVGDAAMNGDLAALAKAAREAIINAAKHAQVDQIDVYAECGAEAVELFVRDRGVGFDPDAVADDRMGVRASITGRVERHGGTVRVRSAPGDGTEISMSMPLRDHPRTESVTESVQEDAQ